MITCKHTPTSIYVYAYIAYTCMYMYDNNIMIQTHVHEYLFLQN